MRLLLLLLLVCCGGLCHARPETPENVESSSGILNHVSLTPSTTSIHVSWDVNDPGDEVVPREYRVRWQLLGTISGNLYIDDDTETTISGLKPCTEYVVSVTLINEAGEPTVDSVHRSTSTLNEAPPAVIGLQTQTSTPKVIILSWERPNTVCEITSYRVHFSGIAKWGSHAPHNDVKLISGEMADNSTRYELDGLLPHTDYSVSIEAYTARGAGKIATTNVTTAEGEPSLPANLRTTKPTANSITAFWDEPAETNGVLTHYHISWYSGDKLIGSDTERHRAHTIAGLSPCVEYRIRVAASTAGGVGDYREITTRTDVGAPPQPPEISCSLNLDKSVSVTWVKPETSCSITGFKVSRPEKSLEPNAMSTTDVLPSTLSANFSTVPSRKFRVCVSAVTSGTMIGAPACCDTLAPLASPSGTMIGAPACCDTLAPLASPSTPHPPAPSSTTRTTPEDCDPSDAARTMKIVGIVVGVIGITFFVVSVVGLVFWRRQQGLTQKPDIGLQEDQQTHELMEKNHLGS